MGSAREDKRVRRRRGGRPVVGDRASVEGHGRWARSEGQKTGRTGRRGGEDGEAGEHKEDHWRRRFTCTLG
jgi:hypothetical protein